MSELTRKPLQIWSCKIGECPEASLPIAADSPMRDAVAEAYTRITGHAPTFIFSGWNDDLTEEERAVHEDRIPNDCPPTRWSDEYVADLQQQITQQAQELEQAKGNYAIQKAAADDYEQQLSASQVRCQVLEKGFADQAAIRERHESGFTETIAQLQATLAGRELRIRELDSIVLMRDATLAAREAEVDRLKLAQQHSIQDECEAEQRLIDAGISDYEDGGQGEYRGLLTQIDLCIKERDSAVQELNELKRALKEA